MPVVAVLIIVALLFIILMVFGCSRNTTNSGDHEDKPPVVREESDTPMTRAQIAQKLQELANSKPPKDLSMGAMCYSMMAPPDKAEYVCPRCGDKTLYSGAHAGIVNSQLPYQRRLVNAISHGDSEKQISKLTMELDETEFCSKCCVGSVSDPKAELVIRYRGEEKPIRIKGVNNEDLLLIHELISNKRTHSGSFGRETPLKKHIKQLYKVLGVDPSK